MIQEATFPTLIAEATRVSGEVTFVSLAQVFGMVEGDVFQQSEEPLQIGRTGWISGSISSQGVVLIEGRVDGNIQSKVKIQLMPTATIRGVLEAPAIEVRAGAIVDGSLKIRGIAAAPLALKKAA